MLLKKQEEACSPLSFTGLDDALPPYSYKGPDPKPQPQPQPQAVSPSWDPTDYLSAPSFKHQDSYKGPDPHPNYHPSYSYKPPKPQPFSPSCLPADYPSVPSYIPQDPAHSYKPTSPCSCDFYVPQPIPPPYHVAADLVDCSYAPPNSLLYTYGDVADFKPPLPSSLVPMGGGYDVFFGEVGLHCYNMLNGTDFIFSCLDKDYLTGLFYKLIKFYATDPTRKFSSFEFLTTVVLSKVKNQGCLRFVTTKCTILPDEKSYPSDHFDELAGDDFFKADLPNSMPEYTSDNLQYYELKESEVEEYKDWLLLYLDLAFLTKMRCFPGSPMWEMPFELRKIIVQTREDVKSKKKAKAENAIFYISFKGCGSQDYNAIIRRTTDGMPQHMSLEVKCLM